jgi:hypothetical protein
MSLILAPFNKWAAVEDTIQAFGSMVEKITFALEEMESVVGSDRCTFGTTKSR